MSLLRHRVRWTAITLTTLLVGAGWTWASAVPEGQAGAGRIASPREGFPAPDFTLDRLDGGTLRLSDLHGEVVVVNLWASWCPPCRAEMPALERVYRAYRGRGLHILAVNTTFQDSPSAAAGFVEEHGLTFPILLDRSGDVSRRYQLRALPTSFFIDRTGVIRRVVIGGPMTDASIQTAVEDLLAQAP